MAFSFHADISAVQPFRSRKIFIVFCTVFFPPSFNSSINLCTGMLMHFHFPVQYSFLFYPNHYSESDCTENEIFLRIIDVQVVGCFFNDHC